MAEKGAFEIDIVSRHKGIKIDKKRIRRDASAILKGSGLYSGELSIVFIDDEEMRVLNRDYRKKDKPTDVLSFPMMEGEGGDINCGLLGDVVISLDTARRQGEDRGETLEEEVRVLLVHGILHLLGYDHEISAAEARRMKAKEKEILDTLY